jgi:DNA replication protein DnaC
MEMNDSSTMERMRQMKLYGMADAYRAAMETGADRSQTVNELLGRLIDAEWQDKHSRRTQRLARAARFRSQSTISDIDWLENRNLDRAVIASLAECRFILEKRTLIVTGPTGVGKSFIAQALGAQACDAGFITSYWNCNKLFPLLKEKQRDGSYARFIASLAKVSLLILDDFGLARLDTADRLALLEILEDRYNKSATILSSQLPVASWHEIIGDQTIADAICDRVVHRAIRIEMAGTSMRARLNDRRPVAEAQAAGL